MEGTYNSITTEKLFFSWMNVLGLSKGIIWVIVLVIRRADVIDIVHTTVLVL